MTKPAPQPLPPLPADQWNLAIDLWNSGFNLREIAARLNVPVHRLTGGNSLVGLACRIARGMLEAGRPDDRIVLPETAKMKVHDTIPDRRSDQGTATD